MISVTHGPGYPERSADRTTMPGMGTHKRTQRHAAPDTTVPVRSHDRAAAWLVLAFAGTTMVSFNMWHAIHGGIPFLLAVLYGLAPVTLAMGLSHVVGAYRGGWFMKGTTFAIMLGAMVLSVRATGYVVRPATGQMWPLFGAVVDSAALVALQVILSPESRAAAKAARRATAEAIQEAVPQATESAIQEPLPGPAGEPVPVPAKRPAVSQRPKAIRISKDPEAEQARADYRKSLRQNQPLSDRALGEKYGRSRSWGAARIREIEAGPRLAGTGSLC